MGFLDKLKSAIQTKAQQKQQTQQPVQQQTTAEQFKSFVNDRSFSLLPKFTQNLVTRGLERQQAQQTQQPVQQPVQQTATQNISGAERTVQKAPTKRSIQPVSAEQQRTRFNSKTTRFKEVDSSNRY